MNRMERGLEQYLKSKELKKIKSVKVGIAGCGGLGSNTSHNLIRLGFKNFILVDFDIVEETNLNRQFFFYNQLGQPKAEALKENLLRINPDANIEVLQLKVDKININTLFTGCDVVVEGFDKVEFKTLLIEELSPSTPCVTATGLGNYWDVDGIVKRRINKNLIMVGDNKSDVDAGVPPLSPGVSIACGKEAAAVLEFVLGDLND